MPAGVVPATRVQADEESRPRGDRDSVERCFTRIERGSAGLPVGVQVVSRWWKEEVALAVMHQLENHFRSTPTFPRCPPTLKSQNNLVRGRHASKRQFSRTS
jgi:fatty acid amide hydrolase